MTLFKSKVGPLLVLGLGSLTRYVINNIKNDMQSTNLRNFIFIGLRTPNASWVSQKLCWLS